MADRRVQYTLGFTADTSKAKAQLRDLQSQLNQLANTALNKPDLDYSGQVGKSIQAVNQLQSALQQATNIKTGKLDLTKFNESMKTAGVDLNYFHKNLSALGPTGQKAFLSLTQSIVTADTSLVKTSKLIEDMKTSLSNTIKWQISSSAIHSFMGAIQGAYGYAQDLNESLNNIRIVTGQNTEQMAAFAKQANSAAKALSTTTTEYTDAALIYYQQGLSEEQVQERTEVTVKMANVARESAQTVSDQMTAVWNNFYDGSKSLEYYSDVMTALGAATASSTSEIAIGLEKFASIADTVGLSYEYATSALATVTSETRQSADVVGTAFRTLFTRIQGLQQGETQDDGVDLNKYSQALANVGVQIIDTNGQIKEMDAILDELGSKWQSLGKEQQIALAQTVGGARQYTTLVSLMDNWTTFQENLQTSYGATGALNEQQEIYAESWEAASKRVTAALEDIYDSLLNDKFFIGLTNVFADLLNYIGDFIDALGGAKGVLSILATLMLNVFGDEIHKGLSIIQSQINKLNGTTQKQNKETKELSINLARLTASRLGKDSEAGVIKRTADLYDVINNKYHTLTDQQKKELDNALEINRILREKVLLINKELQVEEKLLNRDLRKITTSSQTNQADIDFLENSETMTMLKGEGAAQRLGQYISQQAESFIPKQSLDFKKRIEEIQGYLEELENKGVSFAKEIKEVVDNTNKELAELGEDSKDIGKIKQIQDNLNTSLGNINQMIDDKWKEAEKALKLIYGDELGQQYADTLQRALDVGSAEANKQIAVLNEIAANSDIVKILSNWEKGIVSLGDKMIGAGQVITSFTAIISTLQGAWETIQDPNMSSWEKFTAIISAAGSVVTTLTFALNAQSIAMFNQMGMSLGLNTANILNAIGFNKAGTAATKYAIAMGSATGASAGILLPILAVIAALGALYLIFKSIYEAINADKIALEKANEELEHAKTAAEEATNAYDNLKSSIDSLKSAQDTLSGLTKGTLEWQEAVLKVNAQVLSLIDKYPELAKYMTNEDGVLGFKEGALNDVLESQLNEAKALQQVVFSRQREVAERKADIKDFEEISYLERADPSQKYDQSGNYNADKTIVIAGEELEHIAKNLAYTATGELDFDAMGLADKSKEFKNALIDNIKELEKLKGSIQSTELELQSYDQTLATSWVAENAGEQQEEFKSAVALGMSKILDVKRNEVDKNFTTDEDEIYKQFADFSGKSEESLRKIVEEGTYSIDELRDALINEEASRLAYDEVIKRLDNTEKYTSNIGYDILRDIILSGFDKSSYDALDTDSDEFIAFKELIDNANEDLKELLGGEEIWQAIKDQIADTATLEANRQERYEIKESALAKSNEMDVEALNKYQESLEEDLPGLNKLIDEHDQLALDITKDVFKWTENGNKLVDVLDDQNDALNNKKNIEEYRKALTKVAEATTNLLGTEVDSNFVETHLALIKKALNGSREAVIELERLAFEASLIKIKPADITEEDITSAINPIYEFLQNHEVGEIELINLDGTTTELYNQLLNIQQMMGWGAEEAANAFANALHIDVDPELFKPEMVEADINEVQTHEVGGITTVKDQEGNILSSFRTSDYAEFKQEGKMVYPVFGKNKTVTNNNKGTSGSFKGFVANKTKAPKSSGGGGSSQKDKKSASDEIERYHEIRDTLESLEKQMDSISKAKDRAFGKDKLDLMDQEIAKTQELIDAQKQYVSEIEANMAKDKAAVQGIGAIIDPETGVITNYDELMAKLINKFNSSGRTEADEEEYNKAVELIKQWEETADLLADEKQNLLDYINQELDQKLEKIQYRVEVKVEINDDTIDYLDYLLEQLEDQAFSTAEAINLLGQQMKENAENVKENSQGLADTLALAGFDAETIEGVLAGDQAAISKVMNTKGIDTNVIESVRDYRDALMDSVATMRELQKLVDEQLIDALDEASEKFDELRDKLSHNANILSSLQNIMDLTGESLLGFTDDAKKAIEDAQLDTAVSQVAVSYDELTAAQENYKKAVESDQSEEVIKAAAEKVREAEEQLLSDWEAALKQANENFEASIKRSVAAFSDAVAGAYGGLDELQDAFDKQKELDDIYVEDYKKIYELTKLSRDISKSIDDTDSIKAKQALRDLQSEINELQKEGVELSEYDIEYLQKKYELRLAEIALEEAQNAKSAVRMTRDSEGNWSYTYTADQDDIDEAQQNYEDKLYAIQELSDNYIKDMQSQVLDLLAAYETEMGKIDFSEEGWEKKAAEIEAFYQAKFNLLAQQFEGALGNQSDIYGEWEDYSALTGYGISANQDFIDSFGETTLSQLTGFQSMAEYQEVFTTRSKELLTDLSGGFTDWKTHVQTIYEQTGESVEGFADAVGDMAADVKKDNQSVIDSSETLKDEVIKNFSDGADVAAEVADKWNEKIKSMTDANNALVGSINDIIEAWTRLNQSEQEKENNEEQNKQEEQNKESSNKNNNTAKTLSENDSVVVKTSATHFATGQQMAGFVPGGSYSVMQVSGDRVLIGRSGVATGWVKKTDLVGFYSGGYTGEWGSSGKLAMLHEKELVLNAEDTRNILTSVELMREISASIDLKAKLAAYEKALNAATPDTGAVVNQSIVINAEFPYATDRLEIEAAFDNLLNRASQYANRK